MNDIKSDMRKNALLIICLLLAGNLSGQQLDTSWQREFTEHVKSIDEFMKRFNGEEAYPGIAKEDDNFLKLNLFSLLDRGMNNTLKQKATEFVSTIIESGVKLHYADTLWYAEAVCGITYKGKPKKVTLFLCPEKITNNRYRWAICGAKGIYENIIDVKSRSAISPVEHEIHFMELQSIFKNDRQHSFGYRKNDYQLDQLSVLLTLIYDGQIDFLSVDETKFFFLNVPDYVFKVEEVGRRGSNAGWLITSFQKVLQSEKTEYITNLLNKQK